jgi:hypothetical protein
MIKTDFTIHLSVVENVLFRVAGEFVRKYTLRRYSCFFKEIEGKLDEFSTPS